MSLSPTGRPGRGQLAGLSRGDELVDIHPEPGVALKAGAMGRDHMKRQLSRLSTSARPKYTPGKRENAAGTGLRNIWRLEFRQRPSSVVGAAAAAGNSDVEARG